MILAGLEERIDRRFERMEERFDHVGTRFDEQLMATGSDLRASFEHC